MVTRPAEVFGRVPSRTACDQAARVLAGQRRSTPEAQRPSEPAAIASPTRCCRLVFRVALQFAPAPRGMPLRHRAIPECFAGGLLPPRLSFLPPQQEVVPVRSGEIQTST